MEKDYIQILINRYFNGVTTPEEEKQLAQELLNDDIPEDWKAIRLLLGELAMGEAEYDETITKSESNKKSAVVLSSVYKWAGAAVVLLICLICFHSIDTKDDALIAVVESKDVEPKQETHAPEVAIISNIAEDKQAANNNQAKPSPNVSMKTPANTKTTCIVGQAPIEIIHDTTHIIEHNIELDNENLQYASYVAEDTLPYQAPSRMEEFIVKIADYNHVKGDLLDCSTDKGDSLTVSTAYVFDDTKGLNLFNRLLQAACWYDDMTPGYLLSYSHQQFFFQLKDMRIRLQYIWIAERIRGKILLYCTHSPLDIEVSSDCFIEYRDKLSNTNNFQRPHKI